MPFAARCSLGSLGMSEGRAGPDRENCSKAAGRRLSRSGSMWPIRTVRGLMGVLCSALLAADCVGGREGG